MRTRVLFSIALFCVFAFVACSSSRPMAHLIINNESGSQIPLNVSITHTNNGASVRTINNIAQPGLQELEAGRFSKGTYSVSAETNNGFVAVKKDVSFDTDRWIIITYIYNDSLNIQKKYGYVDTSLLKKINGKYAGINLYSETRRPPSLQ